MGTLFSNMGVSDPNRQNPHMHSTNEKGKEKHNRKMSTTIEKPKQHDQDKTT